MAAWLAAALAAPAPGTLFVALRLAGEPVPFHRLAPNQGSRFEDAPSALPEELGGRTLEVVAVQQDGGRAWGIVNADGIQRQRYATPLAGAGLQGAVSKAELEEARWRYVGKVRWDTRREARTVIGDRPIATRAFTMVAIAGVDVGSASSHPWRIRFTTADGQGAYRELGQLAQVPQVFLGDDPRRQFLWPAPIWQAVEQGRVVEGMNMRQLSFAKGLPTARLTRYRADGLHSELKFPDGTRVKLLNGRVTQVQGPG